MRLADLLDAIVLVADHPIKYSIEEYGIVFSTRGPDQAQLETRTFKIDPNTFYQGLESVGAESFGGTSSSGGSSGGGGGGGGGGSSGGQNTAAAVAIVNAFPGSQFCPTIGDHQVAVAVAAVAVVAVAAVAVRAMVDCLL